jgi:hypothetical protein
MTRLLLIATLNLFAVLPLHAQVWSWDTLIASEPAPMMRGATYDRFAHIYSYRDTTLRKLNSYGSKIYQIDFPSNMEIVSVATDGDSVFYAAGNFHGSFTFGTVQFAGASSDIWLAKYTSAGQLRWVKTISSKSLDEVFELCMNGNRVTIAGYCSDTTNFMGTIVNKPAGQEGFVALFTHHGVLSNIRLVERAPQANPADPPVSFIKECAADRFGNTFVYLASQGLTRLDTFSIGTSKSYFNQVVAKLDANLNVVYLKSIIKDCQMYCYGVKDLLLNSWGDLFFLQDRTYFQSGNDDEETFLYKISTNGALITEKNLIAPWMGAAFDMEIDACDNLYFTGYRRSSFYSDPMVRSLKVFRLNADLSPGWQREDTAIGSGRMGWKIFPVSPAECFVAGSFQDTLVLSSTLIDPTGYISGFYARITTPLSGRCQTVSTTGLQKETSNSRMHVFPNPSSGIVSVALERTCTLRLMSITGTELASYELPEGISTLDLASLSPGIYFLVPDDTAELPLKVIIDKAEP